MKSKNLFLSFFTLLSFSIAANAQKSYYPKPNAADQVQFGKTLPKPPSNEREDLMEAMRKTRAKNLPAATFDKASKKFIVTTPGSIDLERRLSHHFKKGHNKGGGKKHDANFHLTKDINTATQSSYPHNNPANATGNFAILNNIIYFSAYDDINGTELWRSDGTADGTYLVKDIYPGQSSSDANGIIAANGLLYFAANSPDNGNAAWVSDGTTSGTHLLKSIYMGLDYSNPNQFVNANGTVFFSTSVYGYNNQLWKTDGTDMGTILVKDLQQAGIGSNIFELTSVNDMAYFIAYSWNTGYQVFRSDGTDAGTYNVKDIGYNYWDYNAPMQLTSYNNKLYFSANDGTGRRLWETDGTYDGTHNASGFNDIFMQQDYVDIYSNKPFYILNNVLYISGFTYADGSGLYKYDAANANGIVLIKDFTATTAIDYAVPVDMCVVNDILYFKVISNIGDLHDELWTTKGEAANTQLVKTFVPGEYTYSYYNGGGTLYFIEHDNINGTEVWKSNGTVGSTTILKDIIPGSGNSYPYYFTFTNNKLFFNAVDFDHGYELWVSDGTNMGTKLVADIDLTNDGSNAGFMYKGVGITEEGDALFNAYTPALGAELYKSDGTANGTKLLNDIRPGPDWSYPNAFVFKNELNYFIDDNEINTAIYSSNGKAAGLKRVIGYIDRSMYAVVNFSVTDNGQVFYILNRRNTGIYELWHSDGTDAGSMMINPNMYYNDYVVTIGNTGFFVAGDADHGYELWKSDGSLAGTKMVKDINPGYNGAYPYSLFAFKKNIYFGAYDGTGYSNTFWKSDGTENGTIKLKDITPAYFYETFQDPAIQVYCESDGKLYLNAMDNSTYDSELWVTNGTAQGTKLVKDINPYYSSSPSNFTDVKGTLFFTADDGTHGTELWSSNGTPQSTQMVKDITPDYGSSYLLNLCNVAGKLYFINGGTYPNTLWSSEGNAINTNQVNDEVVNGLTGFSHLTPAGNKLFFGGYNLQYGAELYVGDAAGKKFSAARISSLNIPEEKIAANFDVLLYPNPAKGKTALQIKGDATNIAVSITDMSGKTIWQGRFINSSQINLPVEKLSAGAYIVSVTNATESKIIKLVKE